VITTTDFEKPFATIEKAAKADGAEVEMLVERAETFSASYQKGRPEKFDASASHCAGLRVIAGGYEGYSFSENLSEPALLDAYREALKNAKFTARAGDTSKQVELLGGGTTVPENEALRNESLGHLDIPEKLERARTLEEAALAVDPRISSVPYNAYSEAETEFQIFNSRGVRRRQRKTSVSGYSYCLAKNGEEGRMAGESYFTRRSELFDAKEVARTAAEKAVAKLGAVQPETGMYPIVIDARVASSFLGLMLDSFSAKSVEEKTSLFADKMGQIIASPVITFTDDPFLADGPSARAFDSEGAPCQVTPLISKGKLANFLTNSVLAKRMKLPHTASASRSAKSQLDIGISNLVVATGDKTLQQLLSTYPKVIYITDFTGYHGGYQDGSGDFSLQSEGELWENGKRVTPLCNFVTSGNILQVLKDVQAVSSRRLHPNSGVIAPDLLIPSVSLAGK
jgi:PmbA protein